MDYTDELGSFRGYFFVYTTRVRPDFNDVQEFAVNVHYTNDELEEEEIVRIDTSHGFTHIDRLYRRDQPKDALEVTWDEAEKRLKDNWREYARQYDNAHGL